MALPPWIFEEEEGDATAPAQFVLKLPESFARRLAPPPPELLTPSAPWTVEPPPRAEKRAWLAEHGWVGAIVAAALVGILLIGGVSAAATPAHGPVGISHRTPKALDHRARAFDRRSGVAPVPVVKRPVAHPRRAAPRPTRHR